MFITKISRKYVLRSLIVIVGLIVATILLFSLVFPDQTWLDLKQPRVPTQAELNDIDDLMGRYRDVTLKAIRTFDTSEYPTIFTNDASVPLTHDELEFLTEFRNSHKNLSNFDNNDWLTYKQATILSLKDGSTIQQLETTKVTQNHTLSNSDYQTLGVPTPLPGLKPTSFPNVALNTPLPKTTRSPDQNTSNFDVVRVDEAGTRGLYRERNGDSLYFRYSYLVKTAEGWRICGDKLIQLSSN